MRSLVLMLAIACASAGALAQGGPPLISDDPDTPGNRHWEINLALIEERSHEENSREGPHLDLNYGLGERVQLKWEIGWFTESSEGVRQSGFGGSVVGVKYRFLDEDKSGVAMSVYPQYTFSSAVPGRERHEAGRGQELLLPVEIARGFGRVRVDLEVGSRVRHGQRVEDVYGLIVSTMANHRTEAMVEAHGMSGTDRGWVINTGVRSRLDHAKTLLAAVGTGVSGPSKSRPRLLLYLGLQLQTGE